MAVKLHLHEHESLRILQNVGFTRPKSVDL